MQLKALDKILKDTAFSVTDTPIILHLAAFSINTSITVFYLYRELLPDG